MAKARPPRQPPAFDLFEDSPDPAVLLAPDGAVTRANNAFQVTFRQAIGPNRAPWGRIQPPPFDREGQRRFDAPAPDGRLFEWREKLLPKGARYAVARDVSDRATEAAAAARAKTVLFATLTHELRTPIAGILGMAGLLARAELSSTERAYLDAITGSGEHLLDLVSDILDFSRLESGRVLLDPAPYDPSQIAQDVVELLSPKAREKDLELIVAADASVPIELVGDAGRVRQILFNLAGNAVKFTEKGGVIIALSVVNGMLRFAVRDTGPGVAPEKQALIFEEFQQADASHARRHGGAGLGLAIVRKLALAMGGYVGLSSKPGQGATFWFDAPMTSAPAAPAPSLTDLKIGVAARNPVLRDGLLAKLKGVGAHAVAVASAPAAAGLDVVLLDAGALSHEALRAVNSRIVVLAAQEAREDQAAAAVASGHSYLLKPVRTASLVERLRLITGRALTDHPSKLAATDERAEPVRALNLRILLAEDNPINALLARTILQRAGCSVVTVGDGEEAVAALSSGAGFDLVFLDLRMPRLDGVGAARRIRQVNGPVSRIPLVALTADASDADRAAALGAGMDDFLTKPIDPLRLATVAARLCRGAKPATV
jgi:signal transduction histidine kinase/CheY-like chemotaxis protein